MKDSPIGIFDSGIGGLSILREIRVLLPNESIIYLADSKNCPYGGKTKNKVYMLAKERLAYLLDCDVKIIVIACNTVTVSCIDELRKDFPKVPIVGIVPVIKRAAELSKKRKIGVLSTSTTSKSEYQARLIHQYASFCEVVSIGTDDLVPFIEKGAVDSFEFDQVLKKTLAPFTNMSIDTLALGCSHFPLIRDKIEDILGKGVLVLDSGGAVARHVQRVLLQENILSDTNTHSIEYLTTGDIENFKKLVKGVMGDESGTIRAI